MRKILLIIFFCSMSFTVYAGTSEDRLPDRLKEDGMVSVIYLQTTDKEGNTEIHPVSFTEQTERVLQDSLEKLVSVFEKANDYLRKKKHTFDVSEVEINASLDGNLGLKIVEGGTQFGLKIILRRVNSCSKGGNIKERNR